MPQSNEVAARTQLSHERLDAYRVAVELDTLVLRVCRRAGRGQAWLLDQAQRAAGSVVLNLVEATGREGGDKQQLLRIARGSALEVDAVTVLLENRGLMSAEEKRDTHELTVRLVSMLTKLGAAVRSR